MAKTFDQLRTSAAQILRGAGHANAAIDVRILLANAAGFTHADLIVQGQAQVPSSVLQIFNSALARRAAHEPIAYIIGTKEFWSLTFHVNKSVLIPRPETEGVVERGLEIIKDIKSPKILDVGTGSGAILMSILNERADASGLGIDISKDALVIASKNARAIGVEERCEFLQSDYLQKVTGKYDLLVSNPPYITDCAMQNLPKTVKSYEPNLALQGGADGLDPYRAILQTAPTALKPDGYIVFEIGYDQRIALSKMLDVTGFTHIKIGQDGAGHARIISAKMSK